MRNEYYARCAPADHSPTDAKRQYGDGDTMAAIWQ